MNYRLYIMNLGRERVNNDLAASDFYTDNLIT